MGDREGLYGLRCISNNVVPTGNGRDAIIHLSKSFKGGKATPRPPDWRIHGLRGIAAEKKPKVRPQKLPVREAPMRTRAKGLVAAVKPQVLERWKRAASSPPAGRAASSPAAVKPGPSRPTPELEVSATTEDTRPDTSTDTRKAVQWSLFKVPELPVSKYHWFPEKKVRDSVDRRGKIVKESKKTLFRVASAPVDKYRYFSEPTLQRSSYFQADNPDHGLSASRICSHWSRSRTPQVKLE